MDAGLPFFIKTSSARFLAPPDPNRIRCAGLRFGELAASFCMQREVRRRGAEMVRAVEGPEIVWRSKTRNTGRPAIIKYRTIVCHDAIIARLNEKVKNKRSTFGRAFLENIPKKEKAPQRRCLVASVGLLVIASFFSFRPLGDREIKCHWKMWAYRPSTPKNSSPRAALMPMIQGTPSLNFCIRNRSSTPMPNAGRLTGLAVPA